MLSQETLNNLLIADGPVLDEATAIENLVNSYGEYCLDAECNEIQVSSSAIDAGKAAMAPALVGMTDSDIGNTVIQAGMGAFWDAVVNTPDSFVGADSNTAPSLEDLVTSLDTAYATMLSQGDSLQEAYNKIAAQIHNQTSGNEDGTGLCDFGGEEFPIK